MKLLTWWRKLKNWQKGAVLGFIFYLLLQVLLAVSGIYRDGSLVCGTFTGSSPCSLLTYIKWMVIAYSFTIFSPLVILSISLGVAFGIVFGKFENLFKKVEFWKKWAMYSFLFSLYLFLFSLISSNIYSSIFKKSLSFTCLNPLSPQNTACSPFLLVMFLLTIGGALLGKILNQDKRN